MNKKPDRKSDKIREHCKSFVRNKNNCSHGLYVINAGEVHSALKMKNNYPAVCSVLGSNQFEKDTKLKRVHIHGPINGATTTFVFSS